MSIYDAAMRYMQAGIDLVVMAGKEYGSGSSRDWAAKGTKLLGVRAVIAESFERIHRSNLVGMGVLPLQFPDGESARSLGLTGEESISITGLAEAMAAGGAPPRCGARARGAARREGSDRAIEFDARVRIDTPARRSTSGTEASFSTSCGRCSPRERRRARLPPRSGRAARGRGRPRAPARAPARARALRLRERSRRGVALGGRRVRPGEQRRGRHAARARRAQARLRERARDDCW